MQEVIRDGALRLLTTETSCDVIVSCKGYRLMAHRVILSIASPVLQDLLSQDTSQPTVLIFPETSASTMSLILDYIYSGSVRVNSTVLPDFLGVARELRLHLDLAFLNPPPEHLDNSPEKHEKKKNETDDFTPVKHEEGDANFTKHEGPRKTTLRKLPNLMPICSFRSSRKGSSYNHVIPSPWCPRVGPLLADPREDCLGPTDLSEYGKEGKKMTIEQNDSNNNSFRMIEAVSLSRKEHKTKPSSSSSSSGPLGVLHPKNFSAKYHHQARRSSPVKIKEEKGESPEDEGLDEGKADGGRNMGEKNCAESGPDRQKPFACKDCGKSFSQLRNFKYHRSIHEGTKEFAARCPECGKTFNDKGYLSSHMKIHRDRKEYGCPHCPKRFNQRVAYNMHLRIHTGIKPHECPTCGKTFSRKMLLKQHQRVHTGERPYACPECGKSFADRSNMSLHARLHTGVKPYECDLCSKSFTKKHHLKTHMNFHTGLKPYSCQKCGLSFSQSSNMRTHYKKCILKSAANTSEEPDVR